jgi:tight adherence protein B
VFAAFSLVDQRNARARLLRDRLAAVQKAAEREPAEDLELLRDEVLSEIPALDSLLRRSQRVSNLHIFLLAQADLDIRVGNMLLLCAGSGVFVGLAMFVASGLRHGFWSRCWSAGRRVASLFLCVLPPQPALPESSRSYFPEAIDTLARAVRAGHAFTTALEIDLRTKSPSPYPANFASSSRNRNSVCRCAMP